MTTPRELFALAGLAAFAAASPAQGHVTFMAPLVRGDLAHQPPQLLPLAGARIRLIGVATSGLPVFVGDTDDNGVLAYRAGFTPTTAFVVGPSNDRVGVYRHLETPPGSGMFSPQASAQSTVAIPVVPGGIYDVTATPPSTGSPPLTIAQCCAYAHVWAAHQRLSPLLPPSVTALLEVRFTPSIDRASYDIATDDLGINALGDPDGNYAARSASALAHEYGHRVIEHVWLPGAPLPRMNEGIADFLASLVTGSPNIGLDVLTTPRTLDNNVRYLVDFQGEEHADGRAVGGALYHARQLFAMHGRAAWFDNLFAAVLPLRPADEPTLLALLLAADDDDQDLSNCTPDAELLYQAFVNQHGIPWPQGSPCMPTLAGSVSSAPGGWSAGADPRPDLRASWAHGATSLGLLGQFAQPFAVGFFQGSIAPAAPLQLGPGLQVFLDPTLLLPPFWFVADGDGRTVLTLSVPPGIPPLAFHGAAFTVGAPFGVGVSQGVVVAP